MGVKKFTSKKNRAAVYNRDAMVCCYCGKTCLAYSVENWRDHPLDVVTLDHIVSQWEIALTCNSDYEFRLAIADPKNLVVVCNGCNSSKKNTPLYVWCNKKGIEYSKVIATIADRISKEV